MAPWHRWALGVCAPALVACALCAGCVTVSGGDPDQSVQTYIFEPRLPDARATSGGTTVLLVASPNAAAGYGSRFMLYTRRSAELNWYAYSEWADGPPRMLQPLLITALERSGQFAAVVDISSGVLADLRLDTEVVTLRQEIEDDTTSRGRIVLRAQMVDLRTRAVLANRTFEVTRPAPSNDARGGVTAINEALGELLVSVSDWSVEVARQHARSAEASPEGAP